MLVYGMLTRFVQCKALPRGSEVGMGIKPTLPVPKRDLTVSCTWRMFFGGDNLSLCSIMAGSD